MEDACISSHAIQRKLYDKLSQCSILTSSVWRLDSLEFGHKSDAGDWIDVLRRDYSLWQLLSRDFSLLPWRLVMCYWLLRRITSNSTTRPLMRKLGAWHDSSRITILHVRSAQMAPTWHRSRLLYMKSWSRSCPYLARSPTILTRLDVSLLSSSQLLMRARPYLDQGC